MVLGGYQDNLLCSQIEDMLAQNIANNASSGDKPLLTRNQAFVSKSNTF